MEKPEIVYLDIETTHTIDLSVREELAARVKPPGSMSKPETIAKWEKEKKPLEVDRAVMNTALDPAYGEICAVGLGTWSGSTKVLMSNGGETGEADLLVNLMAELSAWPGSPVLKLVGHNVIGFDIPFIRRRCLVNRVVLHESIPKVKRYGHDRVIDTMLEWHDRDFIGLNRLAGVLGIDVEETVDGGQVPALFRKGEPAPIVAHCAEDIRVLRLIHKRMVGAGYCQ